MSDKPKRSCYDAACRLLAGRDHSTGELKRKLGQRSFGDDEIESAVVRLVESGLLDDARVCRQYAAMRTAKRGLGPLRLKADLLAKGFDEALIETTVAELFTIDPDSEMTAALRAAVSKIRGWDTDQPDDTLKQKLYTYLVRLGYSSEIARTVALDRFDEVHESDA